MSDRYTLATFIQAHNITLSSVFLGMRTDADKWTHYAWACTLDYEGRKFDFPYRCGLGHAERRFRFGKTTPTPPNVVDVMESLQLDASCADEAFEEWCAEYGYDTDSRESERIYHACRKVRTDLQRWLGADFETFMGAQHG